MVRLARQRDGRGIVRRGDQALQVLQPGDQAGFVRRRLRGQRGAHQRSGQMGATVGVQVREDSPGLRQQTAHLLDFSLASRQATVHLSLQHHQGDGVPGDAGAHLVTRQQRPEHAEEDSRDQFHEHPEAIEIERCVVEKALPSGVQEAPRLRGRHRGQIRAGHHLPEGPGVRQEFHVHHHARRGAGTSSAASYGLFEGQDRRHQRRAGMNGNRGRFLIRSNVFFY